MAQHRGQHRGTHRGDRRGRDARATSPVGRRRAETAPSLLARTTASARTRAHGAQAALPSIASLSALATSVGAASGPRWRHRLSVLPSALGVVALVAAGTGAVAAGEDSPGTRAVTAAAQARAISSGTDAQGFVDGGSDREAAISRDSERQALQDAAEVRLQRAAEEQAAERNAELKELGRAAEARAGEIAENAWVLPTSGYRLTARFGMAGGLWSSDHTGLDFAAPSGTPIVAVANGTITETGYAGAYGNRTVMTLDDGTEIYYCHQTSIGVQPGDEVTSGQQIGTVGSTGNSTGPHLHLEVRPGGGDPVDPFQALTFHGLEP